MKCPKCNFESKDGKKFCTQCGVELTSKCPECGLEIEETEKFCGECGHDLKETTESKERAPESEGERKNVTVLFSDLSGYTAITRDVRAERT